VEGSLQKRQKGIYRRGGMYSVEEMEGVLTKVAAGVLQKK
jgi:hypothetical protein